MGAAERKSDSEYSCTVESVHNHLIEMLNTA